MKNVLVDCSAIVPCFFSEQETDRAMRLIYEVKEGLIACVAPTLLVAEFGNTGWKKVCRKSHDVEDVQSQIEKFLRFPIEYIDNRTLLTTAFELAISKNITVYDAMYLSAACVTNSALATFDSRLVDAAHQCGVSLYFA